MLNSYKVLQYENWTELKTCIAMDICGEYQFPYMKYLFRGQSDEDWELKALFDRKYGDLPFEKRKIVESELVNKFKDLCFRWKELERLNEYTTTQLLTIGQHYGLPTRLLDWTYSLYIALFFAFANVLDAAGNVAIWVINKEHEIWQGDYGVDVEIEMISENKRQRHQWGVFTINKSPEKTLEDFVLSCSKNCDINGALYKVLIPKNEISIVLNDLNMMGINYCNLYGGIEGCAREAVLNENLNRQ